MCIKRLAAINDTLEQLGTPQTYRKIYIYSKQLLIGWIIYTFIGNFYDALGELKIKREIVWELFLSYILNYCICINAFVDVLFTFLLWLVFICIHIQYVTYNHIYMIKLMDIYFYLHLQKKKCFTSIMMIF